MTGDGEWVSYGGSAEIVLVVVLAAAAAAVACAGFRLPLPARLPGPGRAAKIVMLAAWVAAIAALLVSVAVYMVQVGRAGLARTPPADPITPLTLAGTGVVFFVIAFAQKASGWRVAVGSAVVGAAAAPMIFELPFDLIVVPRSHPVIDPGLYRPVLSGMLILVEVTTLALVSMSPAARVQRATLWCLAGMLALFAVWGLFSSEQARPATPPPAVGAPAFTGTAGDRQLAGDPARSSVPGRIRPRYRLLAGAFCGALAMALAAIPVIVTEATERHRS